MTKKIEVEIRGPITERKFEDLNKLFKKDGTFLSEKDRIVLCYPDPESGSLVEDVNTDVRIRTTNGIPELNVKQGKWGGNESRREFSLVGKNGEFDKMVMMMAAMGFKTGVLAVRKGKVYQYKDIEFSLVEVPHHSYYFEAEMMVGDEKDIENAQKKMRKTCANLDLEVWDDKGFYEYINKLNSESNEDFDFKNYKEGNFAKRFGI
ncbi:hypothetical protein A2V71_00820 [Candidatus Berkelbacteria bacterium RBG_13_40_8]|uniref:CYTH domain-containing protein n=1 Tax=Candidatus Berkelbacteria bacterium RBG_13_40_8 TaxID=1797467 RepID=A0A1F5DQI0_9BACT|nr:MAG: hypothetical protein A2V71_00820 [Candidatus Berkelbacteria bacterium RBG_13_40_8]